MIDSLVEIQVFINYAAECWNSFAWFCCTWDGWCLYLAVHTAGQCQIVAIYFCKMLFRDTEYGVSSKANHHAFYTNVNPEYLGVSIYSERFM